MNEMLIVSGARTPFAAWAHGQDGRGRPGGALKDRDPFDLGAAALGEALSRAGFTPADLGHVSFGNMYQAGPHACYGARYVAHRAGCPPETTGLAVNLACGTGLLALELAAEALARGRAPVAAAVGADAPSRLRRDVFVPSFVDLSCGLHIARTVEDRARERGVDRTAMDAWALRSHRRARESAGLLAEEIVPVGAAAADDLVLEESALEPIARSRPLLDEGPRLITHANAHGVADGGAALVLALPRAARGRALGRLVSSALIGTAPERMATSSVLAARKALERARWRPSDVDLWEINETFAAQLLLDQAELAVPDEKLNVRGGAIALGHPFAATGLRLVLSLLLELRRRSLRRGLAAISVGGGQGVACCVEAL